MVRIKLQRVSTINHIIQEISLMEDYTKGGITDNNTRDKTPRRRKHEQAHWGKEGRGRRRVGGGRKSTHETRIVLQRWNYVYGLFPRTLCFTVLPGFYTTHCMKEAYTTPPAWLAGWLADSTWLYNSVLLGQLNNFVCVCTRLRLGHWGTQPLRVYCAGHHVSPISTFPCSLETCIMHGAPDGSCLGRHTTRIPKAHGQQKEEEDEDEEAIQV